MLYVLFTAFFGIQEPTVVSMVHQKPSRCFVALHDEFPKLDIRVDDAAKEFRVFGPTSEISEFQREVKFYDVPVRKVRVRVETSGATEKYSSKSELQIQDDRDWRFEDTYFNIKIGCRAHALPDGTLSVMLDADASIPNNGGSGLGTTFTVKPGETVVVRPGKAIYVPKDPKRSAPGKLGPSTLEARIAEADRLDIPTLRVTFWPIK